MASGRLVTMIAAAAFSLLPYACTPVSGYERFIREGNAEGGVYSFAVPFGDSLATYSISFFTRVDTPRSKVLEDAVRLDVTWTSPSGKTAGETVYMDASKEVETYRSGVAPGETGDWKIEVRVQDAPPGFRGLGIISRQDGTR
ncbi:MAG: hypothetical protein Q4F39_03370 [Bacteroidia bacterium]|nr:hypothetical protein [Bacteroidia bacterium]